jgi:excisionase family DNA binding protein
MNPLPTAGATNTPKPSKHGGYPALFFDKKSVGSGSTVELLTIAEVAEILKISVAGVRRLQLQRRITFIKVGGSVRFDKNDVSSFVTRNRVEAIGS